MGTLLSSTVCKALALAFTEFTRIHFIEVNSVLCYGPVFLPSLYLFSEVFAAIEAVLHES